MKLQRHGKWKKKGVHFPTIRAKSWCYFRVFMMLLSSILSVGYCLYALEWIMSLMRLVYKQ